ncbi:tRNA uridine(34) 5-carboxymethylaminomethyl modification radical SAM/GNAT enzyme Elp3 [Candidatus Falkowbacteria bacterium]|nr:tRNA uridine(34) 5-carboxymethylaminomethyl modification radical SAM/GNAT enzyme Elp3 [Candidatus Falkowbacteria bacterium]
MNTLETISRKIIKSRPQSRTDLAQIKRQTAGEFKMASPLSADIFKIYKKLLRQKKIKRDERLEALLKKREVRTISGVAPIAVLTKFYPCPGRCAYCPTEKNMPKSYLSNEPAVMRAVAFHFDPQKQVVGRIKVLEMNGHPTDKLELIVIGGTWSALPDKYQKWFIQRCFDGANGRKSKNLAAAQKTNETAKHRIIGITLETRPDYITPEEIKQMRELGATRVELGVQSIYNSILQRNRRGHNISETIRATKLLKNAGFKICYHLMPNLPGSTPAKDLKMFREVFRNPNFQPDMIKIYPCVVTHGSEIYKWWKQGKYKPYSEKQLVALLINIKKIIPPYVRVNRLIRDIPSPSIAAGNKVSNLREVITAEMTRRGLQCKCIRCREVGHQKKIRNAVPKLFTKKYAASGGMEYFISFESPDKKILYAFVRLRIPNFKTPTILPELEDAALIRELHTYGHLVPIDQKSPDATQHLGLGKKLMAEAEKIARKSGVKKVAVISGVGVREYYKKIGYHPDGTYMVKNF